jgi:hypothetical protein
MARKKQEVSGMDMNLNPMLADPSRSSNDDPRSEVYQLDLTNLTVGVEIVRKDFDVHECNLPRLTVRIDALARRAKRLGLEAPALLIGERYDRVVKNQDTGLVRRVYPMVKVQISGAAPKIAGWSFGATLDHDGEETIIRAIKEEYPKAYRTVGPVCEHCKVNRRRSETFLLQHDDGSWKQVGRSCLKDFLGHQSPAQLAAMAELLAEAFASGDMDDFDYGGGGGHSLPAIEDFLAYVALAIRLEGWRSRKAAREYEEKSGSMARVSATADLAIRWMNRPPPGETFPKPNEEDYAMSAASLAWARAITDDASEFDVNLRAASKRLGVADKNAGITAYIVAGYQREIGRKLEQEKRAAMPESQFLGEVGMRFGAGKGKKAIPALLVTCEHVTAIESDFGTTHLHHFVDDKGNRVKWFSSRECLEANKRYWLAGTVKKHEEWKGQKQTTLSRCDAREVDEHGHFITKP